MQIIEAAGSGTKILIIAAHADDETIAAFGFIYCAVQKGASVKAVLLTNGDAYTDSLCQWKGTSSLSPSDYIRLGRQRQNETMDALAMAGVNKNDIFFLGYPDGLLEEMSDDLFSGKGGSIYTSSCTGCCRSPYGGDFRSGQGYCSANLLADLEDILQQFQPDIIIYPCSSDLHPDHRAACSFVQAALASSGISPQELKFIVHQGKWPLPQGYFPARDLTPPARLLRLPDTEWKAFPLSPSVESLKRKAVSKFTTQTPVMGRFLLSFVRKNELFMTAAKSAKKGDRNE